MNEIKNIGVFTSGGDSPGMNAAIRAVVRAGINKGLRVFGIEKGYDGMINGLIHEMRKSDVSNIIQRGGTILKTARSQEFRTVEGRRKAYDSLALHKIDGVIAIGGDGTYTGAGIFSSEYDIPFIGLPGTIDNDIFGTDYTIGYDTALNTVIDAVDRLKDTASSHDRLFLIEVMGRHAGDIAINAGIAVGAEAILIPEKKSNIELLKKFLNEKYKVNQSSGIILIAEGDDEGGAVEIAKKLQSENFGIDIRVSVLGHIQRGGKPSALDRFLASRMGVAAVEAIIAGKRNITIGYLNQKISETSFEDCIKFKKGIKPDLYEVAHLLDSFVE